MVAGPDAREEHASTSGPDDRSAATGRIAAGIAILILIIAVVLWLLSLRSCVAPVTTSTAPVPVNTGGGSLPATPGTPGQSASNQIPVPNVVGKTQSYATARLQSVGLGVSTSSESIGHPVGDVVSQSPSAGTLVSEGTVVGIVISTGLRNATSGGGPFVPSALGKTESAGRSTLQNAGYGVSVTYAPSTTTSRGRVFFQQPGAGDAAGHGTVVSMWVSTGPPKGYPYKRPPIP